MSQPYGSDPYRRGSALSRSFLPLALITLGVVFLLGNLVPERSRGGLFVFALGAAFVIGRVTTGRYGYSVPGGILMAVGAFIALQDVVGQRGIGTSGVFFVLLGLGFAVVYAVAARPAAVWPLFPAFILTALGLILLGAASLGPLASLSGIVAYWPVALVLLGVWLLFREALPAPARKPIATLGGLALLAYGVLAAAASAAAGGTPARPGFSPGSPFADKQTYEQPIAPDQTLTISNTSGTTTIHGGERSTVQVVATRHSSFGGQAPDVQLTPSGDGLSLQVATARGRFPFGDLSSVDYMVEVPASVAINAQSMSGLVEIDGVSGVISVKTTSGQVHATHVQHVRQVQATSGSISLDGIFRDAAQISATSGSVMLRLEPDSAVQLDVRTRTGSVEPHGLLGLPGGVTKRDALTGPIGTPAPGATLSVQTTSGSVSISQ